jgi:DNA-binding transcriptional MerR regulator
MDDGSFTIGDLARRTGLTVKTVRFYSDAGLVPPSSRSAAGYRRYDAGAVARLEFVQTLRSLGLSLADVRRLLAKEATLAEVAGAHVEALDVQIRALRLHRAVLRSVLRKRSGPEEMMFMHKLAKLSDDERKRLISDLLDEAMDGLDIDPSTAQWLRTGMPELPEDPSPEQAEAWVELGELVQDPGFRAAIRAHLERQAAERADGTANWIDATKVDQAAILDPVNAAIAGGIDPRSADAAEVVDAVVPVFLAPAVQDSPEVRRWLGERMELASDERGQRYWDLLATINGWTPFPDMIPTARWLAAALAR